MGLGPKVFVRKGAVGGLYKWSPQTSVTNERLSSSAPTKYCNASPYGSNQDFITKYCYNLRIVNGIEFRDAYVSCGYVE
jgi:hypothetical protein